VWSSWCQRSVLCWLLTAANVVRCWNSTSGPSNDSFDRKGASAKERREVSFWRREASRLKMFFYCATRHLICERAGSCTNHENQKKKKKKKKRLKLKVWECWWFAGGLCWYNWFVVFWYVYIMICMYEYWLVLLLELYVIW
jgi:hypothetical protein